MAKIGTERGRKKGGQGRVKNPEKDRRIAANRSFMPTGQGKCIRDDDRRLAVVRGQSTGQGAVLRDDDKRLSANRQGPTGQGAVKRATDKRLRENRASR